MRKPFLVSAALFPLLLTSSNLTAVAQPTSRATAIEVHSSVKNDTSQTLQSLKSSLSKIRRPLERRVYPPPLLNPKRLSPKFRQSKIDSALQLKGGPVVPITIIASVDGLGKDLLDSNGEPMPVNSLPPDTNGSVGETQFVQTVNAYFAVFDKKDLLGSGTKSTTPVRPVFGWAPINVIWHGFGGACEESNGGDPVVAYDKIAKRWIISQLAIPSGASVPQYECIAISTTSDATGAYYRYEWDQKSLNDYPKLGVWPDAYYITYNMSEGARICAYERAQMLTGNPAAREYVVQLSDSFWSLLPSDFDGPPDNEHLPPPNSPCYFLSLGASANSLDFWKFHVDWADSTKSIFGDGNGGPNKTLSVAPFANAPSGCPAIPQLGTAQKLETLGERLLYRLAYRRFADHESLVTNHSIGVGDRAVAAPRWYEIRDPGNMPVVAQQGTFSPDSTSRWIGSIAMDRFGNIGLGYSASSERIHPSIRIAAQEFSGPRGTLGTEQVILNSSSSQDGSSLDPLPPQGKDGAERWGDYSSMAIDPVDDSTFWFTTEYLGTPDNSAYNWSTRIVAFKVGK